MFNWLFNRSGGGRSLANRAGAEPSGSTLMPDNNPAERLGNPLLSLTPQRAAQIVSEGLKGQWTTAQWLMYFVEQLDADVFTIVDRRLSGLRELNWTIRVDAKADEAGLADLAEKQRAALHKAYMAIDNMRDAVEHLANAKFRGYAHLAVSPTHFEPLDQWWWVRDGMYGDWYWNPEARTGGVAGLGGPIDPADYIIRIEQRSLIWLAILKFLSANYSKKWWDRFLEISARLGNVVIAPENLRDSDTFADHARSIAAGNSGWLPYGSQIQKTGPDVMRGTSAPWEIRLRYLKEDLILAGTGGMLTALSQATGIGSGQADEQGNVWRTLLRADARDISEVLQEQFDGPLLSREFPNQPKLAWFELDTTETPTIEQILNHAKTAHEAGLAIDIDELSELTGYTLTPIAPAVPAAPVQNRGSHPAGTLPNRVAFADPARALLDSIARELSVDPDWLAPVALRLARLEARAAGREQITAAEAAALYDDLADAAPEIFADMDIDTLASVLERAMSAALVDGVGQAVAEAAG